MPHLYDIQLNKKNESIEEEAGNAVLKVELTIFVVVCVSVPCMVHIRLYAIGYTTGYTATPDLQYSVDWT